MMLNGVIVTNDDNDLRISFETLAARHCLWDDVCRQLNKGWELAMLALNSDIGKEIHGEDLAWLVCRGKYPFEIPTSFSAHNGQTIVMRVMVLREGGMITKDQDIPCVRVEFF